MIRIDIKLEMDFIINFIIFIDLIGHSIEFSLYPNNIGKPETLLL